MMEREVELVYRTAQGVFHAWFCWDGADLCIIEVQPRRFDHGHWRGVVMVMAEGYDNYHSSFPPIEASRS